MTKEEAKKAARVMLAYANGKEVQIRDQGGWGDCNSPSFNWDGYPDNYRIKPTPTHCPFKSAEECWEEMKKHEPFGWLKTFGKFKAIDAITSEVLVAYEGKGYTFEEAYDKFTFADGTPFGILEEEK